MNIILQQDVARVGTRGQTLRVKDGYARNFLFPRGLAVPAGGLLRIEQKVRQSLHLILGCAVAGGYLARALGWSAAVGYFGVLFLIWVGFVRRTN